MAKRKQFTPQVIVEIEADFERLAQTKIDSAAFVALPHAERVERWIGWSAAERAELVGQHLLLKYGQIDIEQAKDMIAGLNLKAGLTAEGNPIA